METNFLLRLLLANMQLCFKSKVQQGRYGMHCDEMCITKEADDIICFFRWLIRLIMIQPFSCTRLKNQGAFLHLNQSVSLSAFSTLLKTS